jgi:hypothetical protein
MRSTLCLREQIVWLNIRVFSYVILRLCIKYIGETASTERITAKDEQRSMWNKSVVTYLKLYPGIFCSA